MSKLTRRAFAGLSGGLLAFLWGCQPKPETEHLAKNSPLGGRIKFLNVLLHGLCAIVVKPEQTDSNKGIELVIPEIDAHSYLFGNLSDAKPRAKDLIPLGSSKYYQLTGVSPGKRPTKEDFGIVSNIIIRDPGTKIRSNGLRTFVLPWTNRIVRFNLLEYESGGKLLAKMLPRNTISDNDGVSWAPAIHLLTYEVPDKGPSPTVLESGVQTKWSPKVSSNPEYANLHIFAEPSKRLPPDMARGHAHRAFAILMDLISTSAHPTLKDLIKFRSIQDKTREIPNSFIPPGLDNNLDLRHLADLNEINRDGEMANCLKPILYVG